MALKWFLGPWVRGEFLVLLQTVSLEFGRVRLGFPLWVRLGEGQARTRGGQEWT